MIVNRVAPVLPFFFILLNSEKSQDSSQPRGNPESSPGKISPGELPGGVPEGVPKNPEKPRKIPPQNTPPKKGGSGTLLLRGEARGCTENHDSQVYRKYKPLISRPCRGVFGGLGGICEKPCHAPTSVGPTCAALPQHARHSFTLFAPLVHSPHSLLSDASLFLLPDSVSPSQLIVSPICCALGPTNGIANYQHFPHN